MSYYTDRVALGIEDYYAGRGEAQGEWLGSGAARAGLDGLVTGDHLRVLFDARHPVTGEPLGATYAVPEGKQRVAGWDLTFSAPKSVSVLWAIGGGGIGMEVRDAHAAAVRSALVYLEEHAVFSRMGKAGIRQVDTRGLVAAGFVHRTSRSGDPQLHTHVLVSNRVQCLDGVWRALDGKALHRQLKATGMLYHAALRAELTARLGVAWSEPDRHGQADILGVPRALRRLFSSRRAAVEAEAVEKLAERKAEFGRALTPAERRKVFEAATVETRQAKTAGAASDEGLHDRWLGEAADAGLAPQRWLDATINRHEPARGVTTERHLIADVSTSASTWTRTDLVKAAARVAPTDLGSAEDVRNWIEARAHDALGARDVVTLAAPSLEPPDTLRRRDGRSSFERHDATRYTTTHTLNVEQQVLDLVTDGRSAGRAVADERDVRRAVMVNGLDDEQTAVVKAVTTSGDFVSVIVGPAGAGKTRAIAAAADAWRDSGIHVRGVAVSAVAAGVLAAEAGIPCDTIAKVLTEHHRAPDNSPWRFRPGEALVIDEAGMVPSTDLARLLRLVDEVRGKTILVGDPAQLDAVDAGGLFRLLAADATAVELGTVRRFTHEWEADASLRLRHHDPHVIDVYAEHGRVVGGDHADLEMVAVAEWFDARARGQSLVITTADRASADRIARQIQVLRVGFGEVAPTGLMTAADEPLGVGDEIVTLRNDRRLVTNRGLWVRNGDRWTITGITRPGDLAVSHVAGQGEVILPADYAREQVGLAYAVTMHKAQGMTVDRALCLVDERTTAEGLYVGMTRGRHTNIALTVTVSYDADSHHRPPEVREPADVLRACLRVEGSELSATETIRRELARSEGLDVLAPRLGHVNWILAQRPPDRTIDLERIASQRARIEQRSPRLGPLTARGREGRRAIAVLDEQHAELEADQARYDQWMAEHADTFAYRDELAAQIEVRRSELGRLALIEQPQHLVKLIGPVPDNAAEVDLWRRHAARIEAYREQWDVPADRVNDSPIDGRQHREWADTVRLARELHHVVNRAVARGIDHGLERGLELGR